MDTTMAAPTNTSPVESRTLALRDRRRQPRITVQPMYTSVVVRVLNRRQQPIEGYALNLSESGMAVELDDLVPPGSPVTIEFCISGLGRARPSEWPTFAATAEVVRNSNQEDFPGGPYHTAMRFVKIPTIVQAQIRRFVAARKTMAAT